MISTLLFLYVTAVHGIKNVSFKASSIKLPVPLKNHITATYSNSLYIIGGYSANDTPSSTVYKIDPFTEDIVSGNDNTTITLNTHSVDSAFSTISCDYQCYHVMDKTIYIYQWLTIDYPTATPYLIQYNMKSERFIPLSNYNNDIAEAIYGEDANLLYSSIASRIPQKTNQCVFGNDTHIFILSYIHSGFTRYAYKLLMYDTINDKFDNYLYSTDIPLAADRTNMACAVQGNYFYIFGGDYKNSWAEAEIIEKCALNGSTCTVIESMKYRRSHCFVKELSIERYDVAKQQRVNDSYFMIYGGTDSESQENIEIFNVSSQEMVTNLPHEIGLLKRREYGSLLMDDLLIISGGNDIDPNWIYNAIQYMNVTSIFDTLDLNETHEFEQQCITKYDQGQEIDLYLLKDNGLIFEIYGQSASFDVLANGEILSLTVHIILTEPEKAFWEYFYSVMSRVAMQSTISIISELTGINMKINQSAYWMSWDHAHWRMGVGDNIGEYNLQGFALFDDQNSMDLFDVYSIYLTKGRFAFYADSCSLDLYMFVNDNKNNNTFNIGDHIYFKWNLYEATSLNKKILITSNNIIDVNHTMYLFEGDCVLCLNDDKNECHSCSEGIEIKQLSTYHIENNSYSIFIRSDLENLELKQANPVILKRNVMTVEIEIDINNNNETYGLYPNSEMFIIPKTDNISIAQKTGTIIIKFDEDLAIEGAAIMFIDFGANTCSVTYNNISIDCYREPIITPNSMKFKSIENNLYSIQIESNDVKLIGKTDYLLPRKIQTISIDFGGSLYLGQRIDVNVNVLDDEIYQKSSSIHVNNKKYEIASIIDINYNNNSLNSNGSLIKICEVRTPIAGLTEICDEGIQFETSDLSAIANVFHLDVSSTDTYIRETTESNPNIYIEECPIGQGIQSYSCQDCPFGAVGILQNSQCISCSSIKGITCKGGDDLIISYNHWIAINDNDDSYNNESYAFELFDTNDTSNYSIVSTFCPSGFCCQDTEGCDYRESKYNYNESIGRQQQHLCAMNRDPTVPLCGSCKPGYSEVFGWAGCKLCDEDNYIYLLGVFIIALIMTFVIILLDRPSKPRITEREDAEIIAIDYKTILIKDDFQAIQIMFLRPFTYFYQGIAYITIQTGFMFYLSPLIRYLSFDVVESSNENNGEGGVCFLREMNSFDEELWWLFFPFCMFVSIGMYAVINLCLIRFCNRDIPFLGFKWGVVWTISLILIGNIISKMLKVLACSHIGSVFVHFYAGYEKCFGLYWIVALILIILVIIFWIIILLLLYRMGEEKRDSRNSYLRTMTKPYKLNCWYWEIVLLSRRVILAFMVTFQFINYNIIRCVLLIILIIYFWLQMKYKPFKHQRVNTMESICIFMLILCLIIVIFEFHTKYQSKISIIMSLSVLIPILLFIFYVIMFFTKVCLIHNDDKSIMEDPDDTNYTKSQKVISRLTKSQRKIFKYDQIKNHDKDDDDDDDDSELDDQINIAIQNKKNAESPSKSSLLSPAKPDNSTDIED